MIDVSFSLVKAQFNVRVEGRVVVQNEFSRVQSLEMTHEGKVVHFLQSI